MTQPHPPSTMLPLSSLLSLLLPSFRPCSYYSSLFSLLLPPLPPLKPSSHYSSFLYLLSDPPLTTLPSSTSSHCSSLPMIACTGKGLVLIKHLFTSGILNCICQGRRQSRGRGTSCSPRAEKLELSSQDFSFSRSPIPQFLIVGSSTSSKGFLALRRIIR